jgi:penicillin-binding protein 1C
VQNIKQTRITLKKVFVYFVCLMVGSISLAWGFAYFFLLKPLPGLPSYRQVRSAHVTSEAVLFDRNGAVLHEMRIDRSGRRLDWALLRDVSPAMQSAIVAGEDHRFYAHGGVDWISFGSAGFDRIVHSRARGASTISMQLAAMLSKDLRSVGSQRSLFQKYRQIQAARALEKSWSKAEILEAYLNLVTFRGELQGIAAAARGLFAKEPQGLNDFESVILTALVRSPNAGFNAVSARACALARSMSLPGGCTQIDAAAKDSLSRPYSVQPAASIAPHVAILLLGNAAGDGKDRARSVVCTLDGNLQAFTLDTLRHHVLSARSKNMHDGAALVVDNASGEILAYAGNIGEQSSARFVDGIRAMRQAGSTLKPLIYALAFDQRLLTPASLMDDSPLDIPVVGGVYRPKNYDNRFHGMVTVRVALASSLNVPAVKALNLIGINPFVETMQRLDFRNIREPDYYGLSIALGSADITLWDLVAAYRALANGGVWSSLRLTAGETRAAPRRIVSPEAAFLIADILSDRESRSQTFTLESPLSTRYWTAVKTGTSKDMRDNWCVGYSDRYTVGIWAGNFSGEPMYNVSGVTGAAPVWVDIMNWLHRGQSSRPPAPPSGVVRRSVEFADAAETRQEWFLQGTETARVQKADAGIFPRIISPASGSIIALDPDIPPEDQKMFFEASPDGSNLQWVLDGQGLGLSAAPAPWSPRKGKHVLRLMDAAQRELDSVTFEVRGDDNMIRDSGFEIRD